MKARYTILILALAALAVTSLCAAPGDGGEIEKVIKIKLMVDGGEGPEVIELDGEMEVGESRQVFTESGKEVVVTRTEDGHQLTIDGEEIDLGMAHGAHHGGAHPGGVHHEMHGHEHPAAHGGESGHHKIVIRKCLHADGEECEHHGEGGENVVIVGGDGEDVEVHRMVGEGAHAYVVRAGGDDDALAKLEESGVLDKLDEATRQEIIDALKSADAEGAGAEGEVKVMKIRIESEDDDESGGD